MSEESLPQPIPEDSAASQEANATDAYTWTKYKIIATATGAAVLAGSIIVGAGELDDLYTRHHPPVSYGKGMTPGDRDLPAYGAKECPNVPDSYFQKADRMLTSSENPQVTKAVQKNLSSSMIGNYLVSPWNPLDITRKTEDRIASWSQPGVRYPVAKKVADSLGLTIVDDRDYMRRIGDGDEVKPKVTQETVFRETQKFLKNYDITVRFATEDDGYPVAKPIDPNKQDESADTSKVLYMIAQTLARFPKEYVAMSGIKDIVLARKLTTITENRTYENTLAGMVYEKMWVSLDAVDQGTIAHEIGHGAVQATCGGVEAAKNDAQLARGMEGNDAYNSTYEGESYESYAQQLIDLETRAIYGEPYKAELRVLQRKAAQDISTVSGYAHTEVSEDAAETMSTLTTDDFYTMRHALAFPKLRRKFDVIFGRLLYYRPNIAKYFVQTALKPEKTHSPLDAIMPDTSPGKR